ncbi:hypothetical protein LCGC14_2862160 [marine sediment metagenome]|uniref:Uncharacterized protein n=1 Tax=marine sediment metagenome TaxID=412755 RepID=A0A0F9ADM9_9ZZZZ
MGSQMRDGEVWAEMARRKVRFHPGEDWDKIRLWGLFHWGAIKRQRDKGELITDMRRENVTIWCWPSREAWETKIKPLIDNYSLDQLTSLAGWD